MEKNLSFTNWTKHSTFCLPPQGLPCCSSIHFPILVLWAILKRLQHNHAYSSLQSQRNTRKGSRQEMGFVHNTPAVGEIIHSYGLLSVLNTTSLDINDSKKGALALFCFSALFSFMCGQSFPVTMALMSATGTNSEKVKLPNKQS